MYRKSFLSSTVFIALSILLFASTVPTVANAQIVAVVNDTDIITKHDVAQRIRFILLTTGKNPATDNTPQLREKVLKILVDEKLKLQEAKRLKVTVHDKEIYQAFDHIAQQNKLSVDQMKDILRNADIDPQTFNDKLKADIAWSRVAQYIVQTKITITEDEVQQALADRQAGKSTEQSLKNLANTQETDEEKTKADTDENPAIGDTTKLREQIRQDLTQIKLEEAAKKHFEELHENALIDYRK